MTEDRTSVKSTATCFAVLESIERDGSAGVSELARRVGVSKSAVYKHVQTLLDVGYVVREGDDYYLSLRFLPLGRQSYDRLPAAVIDATVAQVSDATGHATAFVAREAERTVYAFRTAPDGESDADAEDDPFPDPGESAPVHASAGGKAIAAYLGASALDAAIDRHVLDAYTAKTITERAALERELRSVRDRRVAFDREESADGVQRVAAPVLDGDGSPVGAVSAAGDVRRLSGKRLEEDVVGHVTSGARRVERAIRTA